MREGRVQQPMAREPFSQEGEPGPAPTAEAPRPALRRLAAVVLLSGSVRSTRLTEDLGLSILDLPAERDIRLIDLWKWQGSELARHLGQEAMPVRLVVGRSTRMPEHSADNGRLRFSVERDPYEYRGTGGVLRDLAADYRDDDYLLVGNGAQVLIDPLTDLADELAADAGDVSLIAHQDGTPSGLMLLRCGVLRLIPEAGFVDMKEQALPLIAASYRVGVVQRRTPTGLPVRTLADYVYALRAHHQRVTGGPALANPFDENLDSTFSIVQPDATVDRSAYLYDSVVLGGARVEAGAMLVRSLVCPGAVVRRDRRVVDQLVAASPRSGEKGGGR